MQSTYRFVAESGTGSTSTCAPGSGPSVKWNNAMLVAVFFVGTGGFATAQALNYVPSAASVARIARELGGSFGEQHVLDTQEKLAGIRHYLSANVTHMAKIFRVGRPTVYSWLRDDPGLRANHARRIDEIYEVAVTWRSGSSQPIGEFMSRPLGSGETLLDLLSAKTLDKPAIQSAFIQIAEAANRKPRRPSVAEIAKRQGFRSATNQSMTNWTSKDDVDV